VSARWIWRYVLPLVASRATSERWLLSLTDQEVARLQLGDVLAAVSPGLAGDIDELADEDDAAG
jgi:hypothetical protein